MLGPDKGPMFARLNASPAKGWPKEGFIGTPAYRCVKTGLNMFMREWHRILKEDGVKVWVGLTEYKHGRDGEKC
jgi:hypothetical protein